MNVKTLTKSRGGLFKNVYISQGTWWAAKTKKTTLWKTTVVLLYSEREYIV